MEIRKAVITAAGPSQRTLPLQTLVDRDGKTKTALAIIVEEALDSGTEDICVVVYPGRRRSLPRRRRTARKAAAIRGTGQAAGLRPCGLERPFVHRRRAVSAAGGDHLYLSREQRGCARQFVEVAAAEACAVSAVQATYENKLPYYGVAGGRLAENRKGLYLVSEVLEKPAPTVAEQRLIVPGLRAGHYLCFFGMHVLTPTVMDLLGADVAAGQTANLSQTLSRLATRERYLAFELHGRRFDVGLKYGLLNAQLALALSSPGPGGSPGRARRTPGAGRPMTRVEPAMLP